MVIYNLIQNSSFDSRQTLAMTTAYETALAELGIKRTDSSAEAIAVAIIHRAKGGEIDVRRLVDFAAEMLQRQSNIFAEPSKSRDIANEESDAPPL